MAQVTMNLSSVELALLYILTGNEDAKTILFRAIAKDRELNPSPPKKVRGRGRKFAALAATEQKEKA